MSREYGVLGKFREGEQLRLVSACQWEINQIGLRTRTDFGDLK
jgi:hypothetical protein